MGELALNLETNMPYVQGATDPVIANVATPIDFAAQFPTPLDPTEILAMCEEISLWQNIPEIETGLKQEAWRELNELAFTSGSAYVGFADGACPEEYYHDGANTTKDLKNIGVKKSLTLSDIKHSLASQAIGGAIQRILGGFAGSSGLPGGADSATFAMEQIAGLKAKEIRLGTTLLVNSYDRLLALGNASSRPLEFDGIELLVTSAHGAHANSSPSGTFSADTFDAFLADGCAKPTHVFGAPSAIQGMMSSYFQLGFAGSQVVSYANGERLVPGINFAGQVRTGVGTLTVVADNNFTRANAGGGKVQSALYPLRMVHNGEPLVYRSTQFPLGLTDLVPGCTAISFEVWTKTALIIKAMCAQGLFNALFTSTITTTCTAIG